MHEIAFAPIEVLAERMACGALSSRSLVETCLERIARLDGKLHAFVEVFETEALAAAEAADRARAAGRARGPLHGIPVAIKDLFDFAGSPSGCGSRALGASPARATASCVRRLEAAGMVVLGKTQMVELAFGGWGTNPVLGMPWNPWDPNVRRTPGGSSSGSAVAVAAGLVPAALGSDTGGSVRTPAAWCGIVGLKTSHGLIGRGGVMPLCPTHDSVGPLTRSVRDAALLLDCLAGPDPADPATDQAPALSAMAEIEAGLSGLRLAVLPEEELAATEPEVRGLFERALEELAALGARVARPALPSSIGDALSDAGEIMSREAFDHLGHLAVPDDSPLGPAVRARILHGREIDDCGYRRLLDRRRGAQAAFLAALEGFDALLAPACHRTPVPLDDVDELVPPNLYGRFANYLDLASLAIPTGLTGNGLPAGLQVMVRRFADPLALRIGRAFERVRGGLVSRPPGL